MNRKLYVTFIIVFTFLSVVAITAIQKAQSVSASIPKVKSDISLGQPGLSFRFISKPLE